MVFAVQALREEWFRSAKMQDFRAQRERLPAHAKRAQVLEALQQHRVLIISGATGCGKSTQLPQYILEQVTPYSPELSILYIPANKLFSSAALDMHYQPMRCPTGSKF